MINYLEKLKEKTNVSDRFIEIIISLFDKLFEFGYINKISEVKLKKTLYNNLNTIIIGKTNQFDYKTGYYDAVKKELYLKDLNDVESVFLRLLYVLTTTENSKNIYSTGYSTSSISLTSYKIEYKNFGINRAVISNLVCRLLHTVPSTLSILPSYRNYENDFLGRKIFSENDIYFLEGNLLSQICYIIGENEENFYYYLFSNSKKYLSKFLEKGFENDDLILKLFDKVSKLYSNYNKLNYLNLKLNNNYIAIKKNILDGNIDKLLKEQRKIKFAIASALSNFSSNTATNEFDETSAENSLSENLNLLEESILDTIQKIQDTLVIALIAKKEKYSFIEYSIKLKELDSLLIISNPILKEEIYTTILQKLLSDYEGISSNLTEKIKYSIINEILTNDKYIKIYKDLEFYKINNILCENTEVVILSESKQFLQLLKVSNLNYPTKDLLHNTSKIRLNNLSYLLNNPASTKNVEEIERIYTYILNLGNEFKKIPIENIYMCKLEEITLIICLAKEAFYIFSINILQDKITSKKLDISASYKLFNLYDPSRLPTISKKNNPFNKIATLFSFFT